MKHAAALLIAATTLSTAAQAATLAGARDGSYRASDGDVLLVEGRESLIGVRGLDCKKPVVEGGRLRSKECWANGHLGGDVDVSWRVEGNVIVSDGKRYVLLPELPPLPKPGVADSFAASAEGWMHNRSEVKVDPKVGAISYSRPKPELKGVVKAGAVLYRGSLKPGGIVFGEAYAFKEGCPPASYPVRGTYSKHNETLTLNGPGPVRKGCEIVAYSYDSPHSKLVFEYAYGD